MKYRSASRCDGIEVLMRDRVSPANELLQQFTPALVPGIQGVHLCPEIDSQSIEIGPDSSRMRITPAEAPVQDKLYPQKPLKLCRCDRDDVIDTLRIQVPTETLELP